MILFLFLTLLTSPCLRAQEVLVPQGCPENTLCDVLNGQMYLNWQTELKKWQTISTKNKNQEIEKYRLTKGLPTEILTTNLSQTGFKPISFKSPCKEHLPTKDSDEIFQGISFIQTVKNSKATVIRSNEKLEVPIGKILTLSSVWIQGVDKATYIPLNHEPFGKSKDYLLILKEDEGLFYILGISPAGGWRIIDLDFKNLSLWEKFSEKVPCPEDLNNKSTPLLNGSYCKQIWDETLKRVITIKIERSCY